MTQSIVISNTTIGQDEQGRYCLNHLHRAAGGNKHHKPANWLRSDAVQALIAELEKEQFSEMSTAQKAGRAGIPVLVSVNGGISPGTFGVKELVYAYATWISPKFFLHVIRAFDGQAPQLATPEEHPANALIVKMWAQVDTLHTQITERDTQITQLLADQQQILLAQSQQINHLQGQLIGSKDKQIDLMANVQRLKAMREKRDAHDTAIRLAREGKGNVEIALTINRTQNHVRQMLFQARKNGILPPLPTVASTQSTLFAEAA